MNKKKYFFFALESCLGPFKQFLDFIYFKIKKRKNKKIILICFPFFSQSFMRE